MGKNKLKKFADMASYDHVFEADFEQLSQGEFAQRGRWREWFGNDNPIVVELGCGRGEYTVGLARRDSAKNYIGVDIKGARMHAGATEAANEGLKNVAFIRTRIEFIERFFAPGEVSEIWVTFPDPQMRKPRKRLVATLMLSRYRNFLRPDGPVHLKTDSPFLFEYTRHMMLANAIEPQAICDDLYAQGVPDPALGIRTYYEQKWIDAGMTIKYVRFLIPQGVELIEPDIEIKRDNYHNVGRNVVIRPDKK